MTPDARERIMDRVKQAVARRSPVDHPGPFLEWRPTSEGSIDDAFARQFEAQGGRVVHRPTMEAAAAWITEAFAGGGLAGRTSAESGRAEEPLLCLGDGVPRRFAVCGRLVDAAEAEVAVSMARGAVADTGSLILDARDGRRVQLLAPVHVVLVPPGATHATLTQALAATKSDLPSALGLHSGPSKSADLGKVLVTGVHGPGAVVALIVGRPDAPASGRDPSDGA